MGDAFYFSFIFSCIDLVHIQLLVLVGLFCPLSIYIFLVLQSPFQIFMPCCLSKFTGNLHCTNEKHGLPGNDGFFTHILEKGLFLHNVNCIAMVLFIY